MPSRLTRFFQEPCKQKDALMQSFRTLKQELRPERMKYMLIFSLAPIFSGMKNSLIADACPLFGVDSIFLMGISYSLGIGLLFAFASLKSLARYARWVAMLMAGVFRAVDDSARKSFSHLDRDNFFSLAGRAVRFPDFGFSWALRDTERLAGAVITSVFTLLFQVFIGIVSLGEKSGLVFVALKVIVSARCLMLYQK